MLKDKDIRDPLVDYLIEQYGKIRILEEKTIGKSRADMVMITTDALFGIEIKSDADTYTRLQTQVRNYNKYYDYNYVVVGKSHSSHIREHVPSFWGIIVVEENDNKVEFTTIRQPLENPKMKWEKKLEILWRPELAQIQQLNHMAKYKEKSKAFVVDKLIERIDNKIDSKLLNQQICEVLFNRDYTLIEETLAQYKKSEMTKKIEETTDPEKRMELLWKLQEKQLNFQNRIKKSSVRRVRTSKK